MPRMLPARTLHHITRRLSLPPCPGLIAMTKTVAREYAARGITANCVAPGFIATGGRVARLVAGLAGWLVGGRVGGLVGVCGGGWEGRMCTFYVCVWRVCGVGGGGGGAFWPLLHCTAATDGVR